MSNDKPKSSKKLIKNEITDLKNKTKQIKEKGRKLTEFGQSIDDFVDATFEYIDTLENFPSIDSVITDFKLLNNEIGKILVQANNINFYPVYSTSGTASISIIDSLSPTFVLPLNDPSKHEVIISKYKDVENVTKRNVNEKDIMNLLIEFGFDKSLKGRKSALEHFKIALYAFKNPISDDNPVSTSLIPMRECIKTIIDILLKCRPVQVKTRNEYNKIISIGEQLKKETISKELIVSIANKWTIILDRDLSSAKEAKISRDEWNHRITQSMLFLKSFLSALDSQKCN